MADEAELYYLQPDFDLSSLTVPRLRSILVAHDINYPSSAKKPDLIDIIQADLLPQAKKLLREAKRVRRTSKGITDVPSSQESTADGNDSDDREHMPPPPAPKTPRSRKSRSTLTQQSDVEPTPKTGRRSKTPSGRSTISRSRTPRMSDTEPEAELFAQSSRRTRKSVPGPIPVAQTPTVRLEDAKDKRKSLEDGESPFTQDNPFQQNSSPVPEAQQAPSTSRSRKSIGSSSTRKSTSRRRTKSPISTTVKRERVEIPVSHLSTGADGIETTEEFTEDARQELSREMVADRRLVKARNKDVVRHSKKPASTAAKTAPLGILTLLLSGFAAWYRQEKVDIGFCGVGKPSWSLTEVQGLPTWFHDNLQPQCEPCPQHATCYEGMKVECDHDFVLREHPLNLKGLVPLPPTCEPDSEKERRVKQVADRAIEELRDRRAAYECGEELPVSDSTIESSTSSSSIIPSSSVVLEVEESVLKATIAKQRTKKMSEEEFEDLWNSALGDIQSRDEVEVTHDKSGRTLLTSTSFANLPFTCAIRRSAVRSIRENKLVILLLIAIMSTSVYGRQKLVAYNTAKAQTPQLVAMVLDRLATQAALKEDGRVSESYISVGQLRDDILRNVYSRDERERAWKRVKEIVERNENVRAATREGGKTGEWGRVWEWIGQVDFVGVHNSPGVSLGSRLSAGAITDGSSPAGPTHEDRGNLSMRKWDEGQDHAAY